MDRMPLEIQTLYAELLKRWSTLVTRRSIGHVPGGFVTKKIGGETYYSFQYSFPVLRRGVRSCNSAFLLG